MFNKARLLDAKKIMHSKAYILVTEEATSAFGEFKKDFTKVMQVSALKQIRASIDKLIIDLQKKPKQ